MASTETSPAEPKFRELAADALGYWEPRRLIFNAVLALEVVC